MHQPLISIIVPCYNVEKYLNQCVDSILHQTYQNIEIILVDDGSTDSTPQMCDHYAQEDPRVRVIHKENGGVSRARNYGLDVCSGQWITFIDSDDWFTDDAFTHIAKYIKEDDAEVIGFNHYYNYDGKQVKRGGLNMPLLRRSGNEIEYFMGDTMFPYIDHIKNQTSVGAIRGVWGKLFKSSVIKENHIRFLESLKIAEDAIFCLDAFKASTSVILHDDYLIHYRLHAGSALSKFSRDVVQINEASLQEYLKRKTYFKNKDLFDVCFLGMASECIFRTVKLYLYRKECELSYRQKIDLLKSMLSTEVYKQAFKCKDDECLPPGKKQMVYAARRGKYWLLYALACLCTELIRHKRV